MGLGATKGSLAQLDRAGVFVGLFFAPMPRLRKLPSHGPGGLSGLRIKPRARSSAENRSL